MRQKSDLRAYQQRFATAMYENDELMLVARPGYGKTISALTAITELLRDKVIRHALVIAPKRVARVVWPDEIDSWAHTVDLRYAILDGTPGQRGILLRPTMVHQREITIVGIDLIPWLVKELAQYPDDSPLFDLLVIDEASCLRNPGGVRAKDLAKHAHRWKMVWGLSGTLRPSSAQDLFMPSRVVTRGKLWGKSFYRWRQEHFRQTDFQGYDWTPLAGAEDKLNAEIAPLVATVKDGELVQPEPTIVIDRVQLPTGARHQYDAMNRKLVADAGGQAIVAASTGVATGKLAQIANGFLYDSGKRPIPCHSAKREWLEDVIESATGPTLLIYDFNSDLVTAARRARRGSALPRGWRQRRAGGREHRGVERGQAAVHGPAPGLRRPRPQPAARRRRHGVDRPDVVARVLGADHRPAQQIGPEASGDRPRLRRRPDRRRPQAGPGPPQDDGAGGFRGLPAPLAKDCVKKVGEAFSPSPQVSGGITIPDQARRTTPSFLRAPRRPRPRKPTIIIIHELASGTEPC